jgi:DNA-directed RNA polymerase specialized sigma24 family protein
MYATGKFRRMLFDRKDVEAEKAKTYLFTTGYHAFIDYTRKQKFKGDYNEIVEDPSQKYRFLVLLF